MKLIFHFEQLDNDLDTVFSSAERSIEIPRDPVELAQTLKEVHVQLLEGLEEVESEIAFFNGK